MRKLLSGINIKNDILKYVLVLASGTVAAQILNLIFQPIITRIYTPEESAELGLFIRIITFGALIATAKYDLALPVVKLNNHAFRLYKFAIRLIIITTIGASVFALVMQFFVDTISDRIFYFLVPAAIAINAFIIMGINWAIRHKKFKYISYSNVTQVVFGNISKIGLGFLQIGYIGLIIGTIVGMIMASLYFVKDFFASSKIEKITMKSPRNAVLAMQYKDFPMVNLPHTVLDMVKEIIILAIIWQLFSKEDFGLYNHTYMMLRVPLIVIGAALSRVFFQQCSEKINNGESITALTRKSVSILALLSIIPFTIVFFYGEELFIWVFSDRWEKSGVYAEIMTPWFMVMFVLSPITMIPTILRRQASFFKVSIFGAILMVLATLLPNLIWEANIETTLIVVSAVMSIYLFALMFLIFRYVEQGVKRS